MWTRPWRRRRPNPELPPDVARQWRDWQEWRPTSGRARTLIVLLAVATTVGLLLAMLQPQLRLLRAQADPPAGPGAGASVPRASDCERPDTPGCPGSKLDVFVVPAEPATRR